MSHTYRIAVRDEPASPPWDKLAPILESLLPIKLQFTSDTAGQPDGVISFDAGTDAAQAVLPSLALPRLTHASAQGQPQEIDVSFADDAAVPFPFRSRSLRVPVRAAPEILVLAKGERALARIDKGPIWTVSSHTGAARFRSGMALPAMAPGESLQDVLHGQCFLEMLPLLHFLEQCCAEGLFEKPALRACFMFDDPNLHWPRYGFVDFAQIAARAARGNYHVSFATIPLDTWFTHGRTAALFRTNSDRLSLLVHGNDHTKKELGLAYSAEQRAALLRQAICRIERLERRARVQVCRVMAAPHGACSEAMLEQLPRSGFESACISHGSLRAHNPGRSWTQTLGYSPTEVISGCPVLPRWSLSGGLTNTILLAAFLGQPLILRGHHQDLKDGVELLDRWAGFINGLGSVVWGNLTTLSRLNYQWRIRRDVLTLKPLAHKIRVRVPADTSSLMLDSSFNGGPTQWQVVNGTKAALTVEPGNAVQLPKEFGDTIRLEAGMRAPTAGEPPRLRPSLTAIARRLATEGRDRLTGFSRRS